MNAAPRASPAAGDPTDVLSPFDLMDAPELAALALLEHAIHVARIAVLAEHIELLDPDAPSERDAHPADHLTSAFFARAYDLAVVLRRYRAAVTRAAARGDAGRTDDDL